MKFVALCFLLSTVSTAALAENKITINGRTFTSDKNHVTVTQDDKGTRFTESDETFESTPRRARPSVRELDRNFDRDFDRSFAEHSRESGLSDQKRSRSSGGPNITKTCIDGVCTSSVCDGTSMVKDGVHKCIPRAKGAAPARPAPSTHFSTDYSDDEVESVR